MQGTPAKGQDSKVRSLQNAGTPTVEKGKRLLHKTIKEEDDDLPEISTSSTQRTGKTEPPSPPANLRIPPRAPEADGNSIVEELQANLDDSASTQVAIQKPPSSRKRRGDGNFELAVMEVTSATHGMAKSSVYSAVRLFREAFQCMPVETAIRFDMYVSRWFRYEYA